MPIKINSTGGGSVSIDVPSTGGTYTLTAPANNATIFTTAGGAITGNVAFTGANVSINGLSIAPSYGMKNRIINGDFKIWQRATSASVTTSTTYVAPDRWGVDQASSAGSTLSQSTSVPTGFIYSAKVQRNNGSTTTNNIVLSQALETINSSDLAGQTVTLSFWAKSGANFSSASSNIIYNIFYGQGTDQSLASMRVNGWTGITNSGVVQAITTTWTRYTTTVTVPAGTTQLGLQFYYTPTGTAGADDSFHITGVQLEVGPVATPFEFRQYGTELALCQRYFEILGRGMIGTSYSQFIGVGASYKVTKRATPTVTLLTSSPTFYMFAIGIVTGTSSTINVQGNDTSSIGVYFAGMPTQSVTGYFCTSTTDSLLSIAAEL
jgi:hypothetical protein